MKKLILIATLFAFASCNDTEPEKVTVIKDTVIIHDTIKIKDLKK